MKLYVKYCLLLSVVFASLQLTQTLALGKLNKGWLLDFKNRKNFRENLVQTNKRQHVERPLYIGSYNVQTLNKRKFSDDSLMSNLENIIHRYDLILITEIMTNDKKLINRFLDNVNKFAPEGITYNLIMSNDTVVNEYCAFLYRIDKLRVLKNHTYEDREKFYRTPFFVLFESPTLRDMDRFGVIGYHVKPKPKEVAVRELNALAEVYDFMKMKYETEDIMLMGDFNAQCESIKEDDWPNIALWTRDEFTWAIGHNIDTTTNYRSCALDRFVYAGENMNSGVILSSARAVNLEEEFDLNLKEVRALSDHRPIEIKIRGRMSDISEKHLSAENCFTVKDSRPPNISKSEVMNAAKIAHYNTIVNTSNKILIRNETAYSENLIQAIAFLRVNMPSVFANEQFEAVMYKINHGALNDQSSYADEQNVIFSVNFEISSHYSELLICKTSTIN